MTNSSANPMSWALHFYNMNLAGVVLMSVWIAASGSASQKRLEPVATVAEIAPATPYADATWVKLGEVVPIEAGTVDVYVRLIAIDGQVVLPTDSHE